MNDVITLNGSNIPVDIANMSTASRSVDAEKFIAVLDIGTTSIRCIIYDAKVQIKGSFSENVELIYPQPGQVEIDPDALWLNVLQCITKAIEGKWQTII